MLTQADYSFHLSNIGINLKHLMVNYADYQNYEHLWGHYIKSIVLPAITNSKIGTIRLIICESAPQPQNGKHPSSNYIFSNTGQPIVPTTDQYLDQIHKGINCTNVSINLNKHQALVNLANDKNGPVILVDILPSHGIKLNTGNRKKIANNYLNTCDIQKIIDLLNAILTIKSGTIFHGVFALPPSIVAVRLSQVIDQQVNNAIPGTKIAWGWPYLNINSGQGQTPSWQVLCNNVKNGF